MISLKLTACWMSDKHCRPRCHILYILSESTLFTQAYVWIVWVNIVTELNPKSYEKVHVHFMLILTHIVHHRKEQSSPDVLIHVLLIPEIFWQFQKAWQPWFLHFNDQFIKHVNIIACFFYCACNFYGLVSCLVLCLKLYWNMMK